MKKLSTGILTLALSLGLAACGNDEPETTEIDDLNRMESPAAGDTTLDREPAVERDYNMGTTPGAETGTMGGTTGSDYGTTTAPETQTETEEMDTLSERLEDPAAPEGQTPQQ